MKKATDIKLLSGLKKLLLIVATGIFLSCVFAPIAPQTTFAADANPYDELGRPRTQKSFWAKVREYERIESGDGAKNCPPMAEIKARYVGKCYSCKVIKTLLETFIKACAKTYSVSREAGVKVLIVGAMIWLMIFGLKNVSSLTNPEPANMINQLAGFGFKVLVAYVVIVSGISTFVTYIINPILSAGADFGMAIMDYTLDDLNAENAYSGNSDIISATVINKIMAFTQGLSDMVSIHMAIGNGMMCFGWEQGFRLLGFIWWFKFWLWLCGLAIWVVGFILTLSVSYYLLDMAFKIGFAIIALPIVVGLWPFKLTEGRLKTCFSIILRSAFVFVFLAIMATLALNLVNSSFNNIDNLFIAMDNDDVDYMEKIFDITSGIFYIVLFCYIYAIKLIGDAVKQADNFSGDDIFGSASPIHQRATQVTDWAKHQAGKPLAFARDAATHQAGRLAKGTLRTAANAVVHPKQSFRNAKGSATQAAGSATKAAGSATKAAGQAANAAGKGIEAAGKGLSAAGKAANAIPVVGQVVGAALIAAGTATQAAGKAVQVAGKATKAAGETVKKTGQAVKDAGKAQKNGDNKKEKDEDNNGGKS